ncbi:MAG: DUF5722 domain-containing protein [bacterium]|nr:DUF5722 domain-containing protein [bacterium]
MNRIVKTMMLAAAICLLGTNLAVPKVFADTVQNEAAAISAKGSISNCVITADKQKVQIDFSSTGSKEGTDGKVYLLELQPYEDSLGKRTDYLAAKDIGETASIQIPFDYSSNKDRLYNKFVLAVWDGQKYVMVSSFRYISNLEIVAANQKAFKEPLTKKGLNIELDMLKDAFTLGVKHASTNIAFSQIMGTGIEYEYNGKTYHFNKAIVDDYDKTINALSSKDISVTVILLNDWNPATPNLVHSGVQKTNNVFYYMFNAATKEGYEQTRAIMSFLAEHYNGDNPDAGKVSNWVIGNEINNQQWNYIGAMDVDSYVREYQRAFRVMYTAIKSVSANDRVYFSLDYYWNDPANKNNKTRYGGKEIVDTFNNLVLQEGQMDWGLAYHPYPIPMTEPEFWDDANTGLITSDATSPVINFANLSVLTDYFCQDAMKNAAGKVRHIILTEEGFTSKSPTRGDVEDLQAAAIAYSYYLVDSNPYIDAYILSRQVDAPSDAQSYLYFGLWYSDMNQKDRIVATTQKRSWRVFLNVDNKRYTLDNTAFAKEILGIEKWSDIIPNFRWRSLEK